MGTDSGVNMALRISLGLAMLSMAFALCATAATDQEDTWVENEWNEESSPKLKTLSMLHNGAGGVCMQVQLPEFVPTEIVKHGLNLVWQSKIGQQLATDLHGRRVGSEIQMRAKPCDRVTHSNSLLSYERKLAFIGQVQLDIYGQRMNSGTSLAEQDDYGHVIMAAWGLPAWATPSSKTISMDLDVEGVAKGSLCFEAMVPSWIPTTVLGTGLKLVLETSVIAKLIQENPVLRIFPDEDTEMVAENGCDREENPDQYLNYVTSTLPFVGKLACKVYGSGITANWEQTQLLLDKESAKPII